MRVARYDHDVSFIILGVPAIERIVLRRVANSIDRSLLVKRCRVSRSTKFAKTAQLWEILAALEAERAALLQYIVYHEAVWTARGFGGGMLPEERTRVNVLDDQIWSARLTVEQWQREVNPVRPQQQQPRKKGEMYSRRVGRNKRERNWRGDAAPVTARSQRSQV